MDEELAVCLIPSSSDQKKRTMLTGYESMGLQVEEIEVEYLFYTTSHCETKKKAIKKMKTHGDTLGKRKVKREAHNSACENILESKIAGVYNKTSDCNCMM